MDFSLLIVTGGVRQSGIGAELGEQGLAEFTQLKVLVG